MAGNVFEWTSSLISSYPYNSIDGREDLSDEGNRVMRGASWTNDKSAVRVPMRAEYVPTDWDSHIGFRCVLSP